VHAASPPTRLHEPRQQIALLRAHLLVQDHADGRAQPLDRRSLPVVLRDVDGGQSAGVDVELALRQEEAQLEPGIGDELLEQPLDRLGGGATGAQVVEKIRDPAQRLVARTAEAAVDGILDTCRSGRKATATASVAPAVVHAEPRPRAVPSNGVVSP
jgi:hypothetical protein